MPPVRAPQSIQLPFTDEFDHIYRNFAPLIFRTSSDVLRHGRGGLSGPRNANLGLQAIPQLLSFAQPQV